MTRHNKTKINLLIKEAGHGSVLTSAWLKQHNISEKLAWWYVKSGWLKRVADGAYYLAGDKVGWAGGVAACQQQLQLPIYPGAKTALQLLGRTHFVNMKLNTLQLFAPPKTTIPTWLRADYWQETFQVFRPKLFSKDDPKYSTAQIIDGLEIKISTPEKAAIECCYLVPNELTFSETALIIEGLSRMRPKLLQSLLENCNSFKAKRLLLYFGDYFQHPWLADLDLNHVDLGKGKRVIAGGGTYSAKYQISVPPIKGE